MTPERHAQIKEVFLAASLLPSEQRKEYLSRRCAGDQPLLVEVDRLLNRHLPDPVQRDSGERKLANGSPVPSASQASPREAGLHEAGEIIAGRYRIVSLLGEGGMGQVYRADDLRLKQVVALKFLARDMGGDALWRQKFETEVRLARQVANPYVCRVFDIGEDQGHPLISMEYVDGENLASLLKRVGRVPRERAIEIATQLCIGLAAAHACGVLHRDLKPANVMLDNRGNVRITDFGLAGLVGQVGQWEIRSGTPRYMAPEQLAGKEVSKKSDIYSLGLVLYEMVCGRPAFQARSAQEYLQLHQSQAPTPPSRIVPEIDPALESVILSCLEKDPSLRPESALDVAARLPEADLLSSALAAGEVPSPKMLAASTSYKSMSRGQMNRSLAGAVIAVLVALAICRQAHLITSAGFATAPQILVQKARDLIGLAGFVEKPVDTACCFADRSAYSLESREGQPFELEGPPQGSAPLLFLRSSFKNPLEIDRGVSPFAIASTETFEVNRGQLDSITVGLAPDGRLVLLDASSMISAHGAPSPRRRDWTEWIRAAGYESTIMKSSPEVLADRGAMVCATDRISYGVPAASEGEAATHIEAVSKDGRISFFAVMREIAPSPFRYWSDPALRRSFINAIRNNVFVLLLVGAIPVAWRNLRSRGADITGATRLAIGIVVLKLCADILATRYLPNFPDEINRITVIVFNALGEGLIVAIFYLALERYVRRAWPHTLIGWSRLLEGRLRDPYVGLNLLVGCVVGPLSATLISLSDLIPRWMHWSSRTPLRLVGEYQYLLGARFAMASCCDWIRTAVYLGLLLLLLLVFTRVLIRRPTAAAVVTWFIASFMYVPAGTHPVTGWLFFGSVVAIAVFVLVRFGLVGFIAAAFLTKLLLSFPFTIDPAVWYAEYGMFALAAPVALAFFGFLQACRSAGPLVQRR